MNILVVGATGLVGSEICKRLIGRGQKVRALVRATSDAGKVDQLKALGAELTQGDLQNRASLEKACRGVDAVISTASTTLSRQAHDSLGKTDLEGQRNLIAAAKSSGVRRFVFVSFSGGLQGDSPLHVAKRTVERELQQSGLTYTILRPSCFMEIWLSPILGFDLLHHRAQIFGPGDKAISFISLFDVAEFAVQAVLNPAAENKVLELGGPDALSPSDVVRIFENVTGTKFEVSHVPEEALRQQQAAATDEYQKAFATLSLGVCGGDQIDVGPALRILPVKLTSVRDYAQRVAAA